MNDKSYSIRRKCENPRYLVITNVQGMSYYYEFNDLYEAFECYAEKIAISEKYGGTFNTVLRQVLITDEL